MGKRTVPAPAGLVLIKGETNRCLNGRGVRETVRGQERWVGLVYRRFGRMAYDGMTEIAARSFYEKVAKAAANIDGALVTDSDGRFVKVLVPRPPRRPSDVEALDREFRLTAEKVLKDQATRAKRDKRAGRQTGANGVRVHSHAQRIAYTQTIKGQRR